MSDKFNLDDFLKQNQQLFTVMGIFGAVSIYLITLIKDSPDNASKNYIQIGILASLFLFTLVSAVILQNLFKNTDGSEPQLLIISLDNLGRIIFAVPFLTLTVSMYIYMIFNFTKTINAIVALIFIVIFIYLDLTVKRATPRDRERKQKAIAEAFRRK